ncbi:sigma-70 family RNA polymerase sigma factor [Pseudoneobacillus sp. C159]
MSNNRGIITTTITESEEDRQMLHFYPGLVRYCRFLSRNKWDGEDLAQETMLKASLSYQSNDVSSALLNKIAYHQWIDLMRKKEREVVGIPDEINEIQKESSPDRLMDTVKYLLNQLTPKQMVIYLLKEAFSFRSKEIAEILNTSEMAIKSTLHRAKNRLKREEHLHSNDGFWSEEEKELLSDLVYQSLQAEDPQVLIEKMADFPSIVSAPSLPEAKMSLSPLYSYCIANAA